MFDIFKGIKDQTVTSILGKLWVCAFDFEPWSRDSQRVVISLVDVIRMEAKSDGISVESDAVDPFTSATYSYFKGYLNRFSQVGSHWVGFYKTKEQAQKEYLEVMTEWLNTIKPVMEKVSKDMMKRAKKKG